MNNIQSRGSLASVGMFFFLSVSAANAQQGHMLRGVVKDPLGAFIGQAKVELLAGEKVVATTTSAPDGAYKLTVPASGRYRVQISAASFRVTVSEPVFLAGGADEQRDWTVQTPMLTEEVTVTATGLPTPLAQSGEPITVLRSEDFPYSPEMQQPLRLVPGVQMTQAGQTGAVSSLFIRGGESNANKVVLDGIPLNDVGGVVNFGNIASVGIAQVEVLRQPNSALYGSDALAGVVSFTTARGTTALPLVTVAVDGGNYGFLRQEADLAGAHGRFDYFNAFARLNTTNSIAASAFHNATFAGNYGFAPDAKSNLRVSVRHLTTNGGSANAISLFGIADSADKKEQDTIVSATAERQTTVRWHNLVRYGHEALNSQFVQYVPTGTPYSSGGYLNGYIGKQVTLTGANGYTVSGQGILQYPGTYPSTSSSTARRDFAYGQTDYRINAHVVALGAFKYEAERGTSTYGSSVSTVDRRNQSYTIQLAGDTGSRLFYVLGSGIEKNDVFGSALTPRVSLAYYAVRPGTQSFLSGTKLHGSFGKGIKGPDVAQQNGSLYGGFATQTDGAALIAKYHVKPLGAEFSRNYDVGVEQQIGDGKAHVNATFFHNEYTNGIQYVPQGALVTLGFSAANDPQFQYGAYVNALAFRAMGAELEGEYKLTPRIFARAGYTYLDAVVQRSFSSDALYPSLNTSFNFATVPIGAYAPLVGARPFRRAPHSGYFALSYARQRFSGQLSGTLVGQRDDSTFLSDKDYGNSLLLPNRNLDGSYQRLELSADYRVTHRVTTYVNMQNLLNEKYAEAFGYPALPYNLRGGVKLTFGGESWSMR